MSHSIQQPTLSRRDLLGMAGILGVALATPGYARSLARPKLTESDLALIGEIADIIIPSTETPGAKAAGVVEFARMMVSDWFIEEEQQRFRAGLHAFEQETIGQYGIPFLQLSRAQREAIVGSALGAAEARIPGPNDKSPFIVLVKRLTVLGYYTSEVGAAQELELNIVPGRYEPCAHSGADTRAGSVSFGNPKFSAS